MHKIFKNWNKCTKCQVDFTAIMSEQDLREIEISQVSIFHIGSVIETLQFIFYDPSESLSNKMHKIFKIWSKCMKYLTIEINPQNI